MKKLILLALLLTSVSAIKAEEPTQNDSKSWGTVGRIIFEGVVGGATEAIVTHVIERNERKETPTPPERKDPPAPPERHDPPSRGDGPSPAPCPSAGS